MMEGGGIFTVLAMLLVAPFQWRQRRQQQQRLLSPHELMLRRASRPLGVFTLAVTMALAVYGVHQTRAALAAIFTDLDRNWIAAALCGAVTLYGAASVMSGVRCWGMRDSEMLTSRAFIKLAIGAAVTVWLGRSYPWPAASDWTDFAILSLFLIGIWCVVVGGVRFLLLTVPRRGALVIIENAGHGAAFRWQRRWWQFGKR
jgi:hypothetical protein